MGMSNKFFRDLYHLCKDFKEIISENLPGERFGGMNDIVKN